MDVITPYMRAIRTVLLGGLLIGACRGGEVDLDKIKTAMCACTAGSGDPGLCEAKVKRDYRLDALRKEHRDDGALRDIETCDHEARIASLVLTKQEICSCSDIACGSKALEHLPGDSSIRYQLDDPALEPILDETQQCLQRLRAAEHAPTGVAECDDYLRIASRLRSCDKAPKAALQEIDDPVTKSLSGVQSMPIEAKQNLGRGCTAAIASVKQLAEAAHCAL